MKLLITQIFIANKRLEKTEGNYNSMCDWWDSISAADLFFHSLLIHKGEKTHVYWNKKLFTDLLNKFISTGMAADSKPEAD